MKEVVVITGGGSGMGLSAAKFMDQGKLLIVSGRTLSKLENAVEELKSLGFEAYAKTCDTSDRKSVHDLAQFAAQKGTVKTVIHAAGLSPNMAAPEKLLRVNALGTVYVNQEFSKVMAYGGVILDVSSNAAYALPGFLISHKAYALAETNEETFIKKHLHKANLARGDYQRAVHHDVPSITFVRIGSFEHVAMRVVYGIVAPDSLVHHARHHLRVSRI